MDIKLEMMKLVVVSVCLFGSIQALIICGKDKYLDTVTGTCTFCSELCVMAQQKRTSDDCAELCPDYVFEIKDEKDDETDTVTTSVGKKASSPSASGDSAAGNTTTNIGIIVGACVVIVIAITVIVSILVYRKKCCCNRDEPIVSCGAHLKARIKKFHGTSAERGENVPLEYPPDDEQKDTKRKEAQTCHPHDDGTNNKLIPSCSRNEIDDI